jgi:hypothetical protein
MWCQFCDWVKPIPTEYNPKQFVSTEGSRYVCYLHKTPTSRFKKSNAYKRTVEHMWRCPLRAGRGKKDFGFFFDRTYRGEKCKVKSENQPTPTKPAVPNRGMMGKHTTLEDCKTYEIVLTCSYCTYVKRWPSGSEKAKALEGLKVKRGGLRSGPKVIVLEQSPTGEMKKVAQWKKMRAHVLSKHSDEAMPELYE